ncbi:hypothetical protein QUW15_01055 [Desulfovibrio piger]|nr:hypothetical protein [Desulfovibrio piger]
MTQPSPSALRDLIGNAPLRASARAAMSIADAVQRIPDYGSRFIGIASAFLILCEESGISAADLLTMTRNCMNDAEGKRPEFRAVARYVRHEIFDRNANAKHQE